MTLENEMSKELGRVAYPVFTGEYAEINGERHPIYKVDGSITDYDVVAMTLPDETPVVWMSDHWHNCLRHFFLGCISGIGHKRVPNSDDDQHDELRWAVQASAKFCHLALLLPSNDDSVYVDTDDGSIVSFKSFSDKPTEDGSLVFHPHWNNRPEHCSWSEEDIRFALAAFNARSASGATDSGLDDEEAA